VGPEAEVEVGVEAVWAVAAVGGVETVVKDRLVPGETVEKVERVVCGVHKQLWKREGPRRCNRWVVNSTIGQRMGVGVGKEMENVGKEMGNGAKATRHRQV